MTKAADRSNAANYILLRGPYPELTPETVVFTVQDWQGQVLCELTLAELQKLKALVQEKDDEN